MILSASSNKSSKRDMGRMDLRRLIYNCNQKIIREKEILYNFNLRGVSDSDLPDEMTKDDLFMLNMKTNRLINKQTAVSEAYSECVQGEKQGLLEQ